MVYSRAKISDENAVMQDGNWPKTNGCVFDAFCIGGGGGVIREGPVSCIKSQMFLIDGCRAKHHRLLREGWSTVSQSIAASQLHTEGNTYPSLIARKGVGNYAAPEGEGNPATRAMRRATQDT